MISGTSTPGIQKAVDFIRQNLEKETWQPGERLPPSRALSEIAGVSPATMIRAVAKLKAGGFVCGFERGRIRAGTEPSSQTQTRAIHNGIWRTKRAVMEKDILSGVFARQGGLPSTKELQARYGICFQTMRKILRSLSEDGIVDVRGKKNELRNVSAQADSRRIVFIEGSVPTVPPSALNQGQYRILELFEQESFHRGLTLETVKIDLYNAIETRKAANSNEVKAPAQGYVLDLWWIPGEEFRRTITDFLTRISALKKPVAILDESGEFVLPLPFAANPLFQVFRIEDKKAGARVARLLLDMGHRSVAFLSASHDSMYSRLRLEGVMEQFSGAGFEQGVKSLVRKNAEQSLAHLFVISGLSDGVIRKVLTAGRTKSQTEDVFNAFLRFKKSKPALSFTPEDILKIRENFAAIGNLAQQDIDPEIFRLMCQAGLAHIIALAGTLYHAPLFRKALEFRGVTAWICVNDGMALQALAYLRDHEISVPEALSIVGFDNAPIKALEQRLTSFDFNASGFVHRILNYIARPPHPRGPYRHCSIEIEGMVLRRKTVSSVSTASKPGFLARG